MVNNVLSLFEITLLKLASYEEDKKEEVKVIEKVVEVKKPTITQEEKKEEIKTEEIKEEVLPLTFTNVSFSSVNTFVEEGTPINYTLDDIVNIMVQATKEEKTKIVNNWKLLDKLLTHPKVGKYASILKMTTPRIWRKLYCFMYESTRLY